MDRTRNTEHDDGDTEQRQREDRKNRKNGRSLHGSVPFSVELRDRDWSPIRTVGETCYGLEGVSQLRNWVEDAS